MTAKAWTPAQIDAARRVVAAALALDRRSHQWSEWYRKTYHFTPTTDSPEWDEFDAALSAFVAGTDTLQLQYAHYPKTEKAYFGDRK